MHYRPVLHNELYISITPTYYNRQLLAVPLYRLNTYGRRAFSVAGPTVWNSLSDFIRDPTISADCLRRLLKTFVRSTLVHSAR